MPFNLCTAYNKGEIKYIVQDKNIKVVQIGSNTSGIYEESLPELAKEAADIWNNALQSGNLPCYAHIVKSDGVIHNFDIDYVDFSSDDYEFLNDFDNTVLALGIAEGQALEKRTPFKIYKPHPGIYINSARMAHYPNPHEITKYFNGLYDYKQIAHYIGVRLMVHEFGHTLGLVHPNIPEFDYINTPTSPPASTKLWGVAYGTPMDLTTFNRAPIMVDPPKEYFNLDNIVTGRSIDPVIDKPIPAYAEVIGLREAATCFDNSATGNKKHLSELASQQCETYKRSLHPIITSPELLHITSFGTLTDQE